MPDCSTDTLFNNRITIRQHISGYRFSIDPVLLSHFVIPRQNDTVLDLGTGCGIIPLILTYRHPKTIKTVTGIEIQPALADLARENTRPFAHRINICQADMTDVCRNQFRNSADLIVSNPPYTRSDSGRVNPDSEKAVARHELTLTLDSLISSAASALKKNGRFAVIYPQSRIVDLLSSMRSYCIEPRRIRMIHARPDEPAKRVLVEGVLNGGTDAVVEPQLIIYEHGEHYSGEVQKMFMED